MDDVQHLPWGDSPQLLIEKIIINWDVLKPRLEDKWNSATPSKSLQEARLRAPVPRPGKVLMGQGNFMEGVRIEPPRPLSTFFKSPDSVIGDGDTVVLPKFRPVIFNHEAELCVVIGQPAKEVSEAEALQYVFGYTTGVDVSARAPEPGESALAGNYGKSFDTFLPIGPHITTADEIDDPNNLRVQYWVNERLRQDYNTSDMEHSVALMIATLSWNMTLKPGDLIMCGTNHGNLGPMQDGDLGEIEIERVGRSSHRVVDDLKRTWDPNVVRNPADNAARRETLKNAANGGTWPFQAVGGQAREP
jgi:2-keto-4-pentenoate hydratase/2-oxohepta-3-ene-1,7-dioic acid hydratase in catechol pathway